ncbi:MAG: hypothetical protein FD149_225 [Rhodospirillaceae bacterium]|nr:MAG: hypothetical protein FD149_225 [Rhodospirillaceae bacterium]
MSTIAKMFFAYGLTAVVSLAVAVLIKLMTSALSGMQAAKAQNALKPSSVPAGTVPAARSDEAVIAVIAAAVAATMGSGARIVRIEEGGGRSALWTASGRLVHQTSHVVTRRPPTKATSLR